MSLTLFSKSALDRFYFCWRCARTNKLLADWCGGWGSGLQNWTADLNRYLLVESAEGFHDDGGQVLKFRFLCNRGFAERGFKLVKKTKDVVKATLSLRLPVLRLKYAPISIMSYCTCVFFFYRKYMNQVDFHLSRVAYHGMFIYSMFLQNMEARCKSRNCDSRIFFNCCHGGLYFLQYLQ